MTTEGPSIFDVAECLRCGAFACAESCAFEFCAVDEISGFTVDGAGTVIEPWHGDPPFYVTREGLLYG